MSAAVRAVRALRRLAYGTAAFLEAVHRNYQEAHDEPAVADRDIEIEANRIEDTTGLSWRESVIVAQRQLGEENDGQLCRIMGRSMVTVERSREKLRKRQRDAEAALGVLDDVDVDAVADDGV